MRSMIEDVPLVVRCLVAAEQACNVVQYYSALCDLSASPVMVDAAAFSESAQETADCTVTTTETSTRAQSYKIVYDVMRTRDRRILFKQSYAERFVQSLALAAPAHTFPAELQQRLQERLQCYIDTPGVYNDGVNEQNLKIVSWVAEDAVETSAIPVFFFLAKSSYPAEAMYRYGAKFGLLYNAHRTNPNAKVAQTALRDRANAFQKDNDVYETLLVHGAADQYLVPEGSRSNYLLRRRDGSWWCSAAEDILVGITLKTTYRVIEACGLGTVQHGKLNLRDILECSSLYMLGTSPTILPIQSVLLYKDEETRRIFEEAVQALGVDLANTPSFPIQQTHDGSRAERSFPIDTELAARLRAQYFTEAAAS